MPRHPRNSLTPQRIREARNPGDYADGNGLYLRVDDTGTKRWVQRLTIRGKRHNLGLGGYPAVPLQSAREQALANKRAARDGRDPLAERRRQVMPTFAEATATVADIRRPTWKSQKYGMQWQMSLRVYAFPVLADRAVGDITTAEVLRVLTPIWTAKPETARKVRQRIATVLDWAVAQGFRDDNPAGKSISLALPRMPRVGEHHRALPHGDVAAAIRTVWASEASRVVKLSTEFLILTATRSGQVRGATWAEVDLESRTWTIPAARMKASRDHRVPLSGRALAILDAAKKGDVHHLFGLVFPSPVKGGQISDMTYSKLLKDLSIPCVPHGFRSSFRDFASELTDAPREVAEAVLAHKLGDATELAYARSDLFDRRRKLMQEWADYLGGQQSVAEMVEQALAGN